MTRAEALAALLAAPIPRDLVGLGAIGYHYTLGREPLRDPELIKRDLGIAYVARRRQDWGQDVSCVVSVRRQPKLKVVNG